MSPRRLAPFLLMLMLLAAVAPGTASAATMRGTVPLRGMTVELLTTRPGDPPEWLGRTISGPSGYFHLRYGEAPPGGVDYVLATAPDGRYRVAAAIGEGNLPHRIVVDDRTTVAMAYAMAQFVDRGKVMGRDPGLRNAAAMSADLVDLHGSLSPVLTRFPNGGSTSTEATFGSLANLVALCHRADAACTRFLALAGAPGRGSAPDTLTAAVDIARNPWHHVGALYGLSLRHTTPYAPSLREGEPPAAWTLALRFEGEPPGLDGPGNFAIDGEGNLWVANNYAYSRESRKPACFSDKLFRFTPTGRTYPRSPYVGGGLSGVGFGVTIDPFDRVWLGNFGFGVEEACEEPIDHFTASAFTLSGRALSPETGWNIGGINWPQGTISDQKGNIWLANCGNDSVTKIEPPRLLSPAGAPPPATNFGAEAITAGGAIGFERPFGDAVNAKGEVFVTANGTDSVARLAPDGRALGLVTGGGLHLPMGIAGDDNGYMWVSNSKWVVAPCPGKRTQREVSEEAGKGGGTVTLLKPDGKVAAGSPITGGGLNNPWGIAVDGGGHVWVANFGGQRLTELCGTEPRTCPPGKRGVGAPISPEGSGYAFDGLVRNTGVAIDPSGNVWLANNWKNVPIQTNPGGYQIVAYLGLGTPTAAPQIGPPARP